MKSERFVLVEDPSSGSARLTTVQQSIWEGLRLCDSLSYQGLFLGPSGIGKTHVISQYAKGHEDIEIFRVGIAETNAGLLLRMLSGRLGGCWGTSNSDALQRIVRYLCSHWRLLIIDESHLLGSWESWELFRQIHDESGCPVVYVGQPTLYRRMKGKGPFSYDQILGRLPVRRIFQGTISRGDCETVIEAIHPGLDLDRKALNFLHKKAQSDGKLRQIKYLLKTAEQVAGDARIDYTLLVEVAKGLGL